VRPKELAGFHRIGRFTPFDGGRPLYAQMLGAGYTVLGTVPLREVLLGRVADLWQPFAPEPRVKDKRGFLEFAERGRVKILLGFQLGAGQRDLDSGTLVTATLQVWDAVDPVSRPLRAAWPVLGAVGGWIARSFLTALENRAGASAPTASDST